MINHYQEKQIGYWLNLCPELETETYIATEKLDGTNFQLHLVPQNDTIRVGRRNDYDQNHMGIQDVLSPIQERFTAVHEWVNETGNELRLYGEYYGNGILGRVPYGPRNIRFFDASINGDYVSPEYLARLLTHWGLSDLSVPVIGTFDSLNDALDIEVEGVNSAIAGKQLEGVVIKPYSRAYSNHDGSMFYIKKKATAFSEIEATKEEKPVSVHPLAPIFATYINENRVLSVFSKEGEIQSPEQLGTYIKLVIEDAKKDFFIDNPEAFELSKAEQKQVYNVGNQVVKLLKAYL